ncbi:MAG: Eco57I restriction-modification methylase domain-containing protein, partial [Promethearchaeota archaeon]
THILPNMTMLDPCAGGGVFLRAIIRRLVWYHLVLGHLWPKQISGEAFNITSELGHLPTEEQLAICTNVTTIIEQQLYFVDLNPKALEVTIITVKTQLLGLFPSTLPFLNHIRKLQFHALHANAVEGALDSFPPQFHIIIGNPPYIGSDMMNRIFSHDIRQKLKTRYRHVIKTGSKHDYYFYFVARSIELLAEGGQLLFIIPNRILSNDYAQTLRAHIFQKATLTLVANFPPPVVIFPSANVHPCILGLTRHEHRKPKEKPKPDWGGKLKYWGGDITTIPNTNKFSLFHTQMHQNSLGIAQNYGIFFPSVSPEMQAILHKITTYPRLSDYLTVHEGTRMARVTPQLPPTISAQISSAAYINLPPTKQALYVGEIRGKNITRFAVNDTPSDIKFFLALPELLPEKSTTDRIEKLTRLSQPTVFIRELGDRLFAGLRISHDRPLNPIIGYGGVYFFGLADFHASGSMKGASIQSLYAFLVYLSTSTFLKIYQTLFSAGKWGTALKFRSSYLERMPVIPFDQVLVGKIGEMLSWLHKGSQFSPTMETIRKELVVTLERLVDNHLQDQLSAPEENDSIQTTFDRTYSIWNSLKKLKDQEEIQSKLKQLQKSLDKLISS